MCQINQLAKITPQKSSGPKDSHDEFCQIFKEEIILISHKLFQKVEEEGPPKAYGSWWRVLTKCSPLEKGMANYFSILASRTLWTVWEGEKKKAWSYLILIASSKTLFPKKILNKGSQWMCTLEERIFNLVQREGITPHSLNETVKEETDRRGSILKTGLHLGPDSGLSAICPVSMERTYQLENQTPGWKSPRART